MPELPPEIICTIVDELDMDKPEDRKTLRSLLFVSKQMNSFALRALYQEISFVRLTFDEQVLGELCALARDVESNPGLPFTTTFLCILGRGYKVVETYWDEINKNIGCIIPFLVNLRRMAICFQDGPADTRILRSLPSSAPLTHLRLEECSLSCEDLLRFLRCRPALQWLDVYTRGQAQMTSGSGLPVDVLPHLASLSIAYGDIGILKNLLSSLVTLTLHTFMGPIDGAGMIRRSMAPFALITACYLPAIDIAIIVPIVTSLPRLEYLWVEPAFGQEDTDYRGLSATKLKYLRCYSYHEAPRSYGRKILGAIKTLVVVDVTLYPCDALRLCRGEERPVDLPFERWSTWWEHAKRAVESASCLSVSNTASPE